MWKGSHKNAKPILKAIGNWAVVQRQPNLPLIALAIGPSPSENWNWPPRMGGNQSSTKEKG
jgi:hypothetical protein